MKNASSSPGGKSAAQTDVPSQKTGSSADQLAKSLDIIDALAFLPVLLAGQAQAAASTEGEQASAAYSGDAISDLLDAISNALETGDTGDLMKALEGDRDLRALLSGATGPAAGNSAETAKATEEGGAASGSSSLAGLTSLAQLLQGMTGQGTDQTEKDGTAQSPSTDGPGALELLLRSMAGSEGGAEETLQQSVASASTGLGTDLEQEGASSSGEEKETALSSSTGTEGANDDVVRNTMLLGTILSNLLTVKSEATGGEAASASEESDSMNQRVFGPPASTTEASQRGGTAGANASGSAPAAGKEAATSLSGNQSRSTGAAGLSEDYVILNEAGGGQSKSASASARTGGSFEVLFAADNTGKEGADAEASVPVINVAQNVKEPGAGTKAARAEGLKGESILGSTGNTTSEDESATAETTLEARVDAVTEAMAKNPVTGHGKKGAKYAKAEPVADGSARKNDTLLYTQDAQAKVQTSRSAEHTTGVDKGSYAALMAEKIEEIATTYAGRSQSADMVLRLNIDDKESLLVGLKEQGNKVIVEVKGASETVMNTLQLHKDAIMRELENKNIYATIHVDTNGENPSGKREQGQRQQGRNGSERRQEEFGGILDALA